MEPRLLTLISSYFWGNLEFRVEVSAKLIIKAFTYRDKKF